MWISLFFKIILKLTFVFWILKVIPNKKGLTEKRLHSKRLILFFPGFGKLVEIIRVKDSIAVKLRFITASHQHDLPPTKE